MATLHEHKNGGGYYIIHIQFIQNGQSPITYQVGNKGLRRLDAAGIRNDGDFISDTLLRTLRDVYKEIYTKATLVKFLKAAKAGETNKVATLIDTKMGELDIKGEDGRTAISWAAERGHKDTVVLLLQRGADKMVEDDYGHNAKWWAEFCQQTEIAKML